jgi:hypothetical protein
MKAKWNRIAPVAGDRLRYHGPTEQDVYQIPVVSAGMEAAVADVYPQGRRPTDRAFRVRFENGVERDVSNAASRWYEAIAGRKEESA